MFEPILEIEDLCLNFSLNHHRAWTLKQLTVDFASKIFSSKKTGLEHYEKVAIVENFNLKVNSGDRIGILGLNGTGKTSLCRCIAGIYQPTSGKILIRGKLRAIFNTSIGIQPELTGRENIKLLVELLYPEEKHKRELVDEIIEFTELGEYINFPFRLYSNGMQARAFLSVVSIRPADLLILDEVFDGTDYIFSKKISQKMHQNIRASGAVLFVSHSLDQIRRTCNKVLILHNGKTYFLGDVEEGILKYLSFQPELKFSRLYNGNGKASL